MKKIFTLITVVAVLFAGKTTISAEENSNQVQSVNNQNRFVEQFDWNDVEEIEFIYLELSDTFYNEATAHNVKIRVSSDISKSPFSIMYASSFKYFSSISWIKRSESISLSLNAKNPWAINKEESWHEAIKFFQYHPMYKSEKNSSKYSSMQNQYYCHVDFAKGLKTPWNIEPWRADKGYWGVVGSHNGLKPTTCN